MKETPLLKSIRHRRCIEGWTTVLLVLGLFIHTLQAQTIDPTGQVGDGSLLKFAATQGGFFAAAALMLIFWLRDIKRYEAEIRDLTKFYEEGKQLYLKEAIASRDEEIARRRDEFQSLVRMHTDAATTLTKLTGSIETLLGQRIRTTDRL